MKILVKTCDRDTMIETDSKDDVSQILHEAGIILNKRCGGEGTCGGCNVLLESGEFIVGTKLVLSTATRPRNALACKTRMKGNNGVIRVPSRSRLEVNATIEDEFTLSNFQLNPTVKKIYIAIPPATLEDHRSDQERIIEELCKCAGLKSIALPFNMTLRLSTLLGGGTKWLTATVVENENSFLLTALEDGQNIETNYGLALDIGTTTVAGILIDLNTGRVLQKASRYNQQLQISADVASRISKAKSPSCIERLQKLLTLDTINPIINSVCNAEDIRFEDISRMSFAGNTVMMHLLLGLNVTNIGKLPFNPITRSPTLITVEHLGINGGPNTPVDIIPAISGYIGGDITADIYVVDMPSLPNEILVVDLGTNAEMVFKVDGELICCATPAGPAFEGGGLLHGCRAAEGAIERISIGPGLTVEITCIGGRDPTGICGSAIIDFIAEGYRCGLINEAGRMDVAMMKLCGRHAQIEVNGRSMSAFVVVSNEGRTDISSILITEADIAEIMLAKSAIFAGMKTLVEHCGHSLAGITRLVLAGGFAKHINIENAICIGLLPKLLSDQFQVIGNGALAGAYLTLVDGRAGKAMRDLSKRPKVIELNLIDSFEDNFVQSLYLPALI